MRFTLQPKKWYACELIGDEFIQDKCSYSPIRVDRIEPLGRGNLSFRLHFYHANYPEGVREKCYTLETIERGKTYLLARCVEYDLPRFLQIYDIVLNWVKNHFSRAAVGLDGVQNWLDLNA